MRIPTLENADFIDISGWQAPISGREVAAKVDTVWVRSALRTSSRDSYWWPFQEQLREAGVQVNSYAVWDSRYSGMGHWQNFKKELIRCPVGDRHHMDLAIDVEDGVRRTRAQIRELKVLLEESSMWNGRPTHLYTVRGLWNDWANSGPVAWARDYPLWVVDYNQESIEAGAPILPTDWETWACWQYSGNGNLMGDYYGCRDGSSVDLNIWNINGK